MFITSRSSGILRYLMGEGGGGGFIKEKKGGAGEGFLNDREGRGEGAHHKEDRRGRRLITRNKGRGRAGEGGSLSLPVIKDIRRTRRLR